MAFFQSHIHCCAEGNPEDIEHPAPSRKACFGRVSSIWSTNFDGLVERAAHKVDVSCVNINIDTADLIYSRPTSADLLYVALHGDYKFSSLKNSSREPNNSLAI